MGLFRHLFASHTREMASMGVTSVNKRAQAKLRVCRNCGRWWKAGKCLWCGFDATNPAAVARLRAEQSRKRAKRHASWQRMYTTINALFHINVTDFLAFLRIFLKWTALGSGVGILAGTASAVFLVTLSWATQFRLQYPALLVLLPVAGFLVGWVYYHFAGVASQGNNLVIEEVNANKAHIPFRMAPLILVGTVITHLFGGSAGREGTAIQMGASLADSLRRLLRLPPEDRRLIIMAGISGGFGSVFGTPVAGFIFGMEVQSLGRIRYEGIIPCLVAAYVGDIVTRAWGAAHSHYPALINLEIEPLLLIKVALAGVAFGLTSILFVELTHSIKYLQTTFVKYPPLRSCIGGIVIIALVLLVGTQDYLGLSLPLIHQSVSGEGVVAFAFLLKLIFTSITLGSGFLGGEVTPLFVIGSTLGYTLGRLLGVDPTFLASVGFVAVFAGASNTPFACALMGIELFGGGSALYLFVGCMIAYLASGHRGIYTTQLVGTPKISGAHIAVDESLKALAERRAGWLPPLPDISGDQARRTVHRVMTRKPIAVHEDTYLREAIRIALREGIRALPVVNDENIVVGIITDNDLQRADIGVNLSVLIHLTENEQRQFLGEIADIPVNKVMSAPAQTVLHASTLLDAIGLMNRHQLKRLPVVDTKGHLMGMITRSDILRELAFTKPSSLEKQNIPFDWLATVADVELETALMVSATARPDEVLQCMQTHQCKRVLVGDAMNKVIGIITEGDLLARVPNNERARLVARLDAQTTSEYQHAPFSGTASEIMTTPVFCVSPSTLASEALQLLMDNQIKRLPVINENHERLGLVGRAGLMRALLKE
jgi:H+/Cl- antiporter ClcA/CBS domain-containing protein